ncbi:MAG TPA: DUF6072 family protein [Pyrinomonadaceae bacterium]|jgi:hypothetical protein
MPDTTVIDDEPDYADPVKKTVLFTSEYLVPGGSNLIQGDLKQGGLHVALGLAAKAFFGLPGLLVVSANSFTKAATGRHIHEHLGLGPTTRPTPPPPTRTPTTTSSTADKK